ncbi:MAG: hypothetical protein KTQ49_00185 [Candidatus Omnitrophica bacterium]|nr:hypothetical protein [Candidatus Omnitrophota bacterium]
MKKKNFVLSLTWILFASLALSLPESSAENNAVPTLSLTDLALPEALGKVQERYVGQSPRTVIQVQDVHAHFIAQENIAAILDHLREAFGIQTVALEGAWTATALTQSRAIPTSREKQLLARSLLEEDRLSGPLYAGILASSPLELVGIEDAPLYEKNRESLLAHRSMTSEILEKLEAAASALREEQAATWTDVLRSFAKAYGDFHRTSDLGKFFKVLTENAAAQGVKDTGLDQIALVREIMDLENSIPRERFESEVRDLTQKYKNTSWNFEELLRSGNIASEKYGGYPEIKKFRQLIALRDKVTPADLNAQIQVLKDRIADAMFLSPEARALWDRTERFYLAEKVLLLKATPSDLKRAEREKLALEAELETPELTAAWISALEFYALVQARDEVFFERIMRDPALRGPVAVVTGGFHTDGLSQKLREAGISFVTLTPELGEDTTVNEALYLARMQENPAGDQTLSELRNATAAADEQFTRAYTVLLQTKDVRKAVAAFLGGPLSVSDAEKPSHLRATRKIFESGSEDHAIPVISLKKSEFMSRGREDQLAAVRDWMERSRTGRRKTLLVSQASVLKDLIPDRSVPRLIESIIENHDTLVLAQDLPVAELPEALLAPRGIDRFEVEDIGTLVTQTPRFRRLAQKYPFAIMKDGYQSDAYVVLPEAPVSLVLYRVVALSPDLYGAAKDPEFLGLLRILVEEIIGQESYQKAA